MIFYIILYLYKLNSFGLKTKQFIFNFLYCMNLKKDINVIYFWEKHLLHFKYFEINAVRKYHLRISDKIVNIEYNIL